MYIPETLSSNPKWAGWIERLPDIVAACAKRWDLRIEDPMTEDYAEMSYSYIAPARDAKGTEVILKLARLCNWRKSGNKSATRCNFAMVMARSSCSILTRRWAC